MGERKTVELANRLLAPLDSEIMFANAWPSLCPCRASGLDLEVAFSGYPTDEEIVKIAAALGVPVEDCDDIWGGCPSCGYGTMLVVHGWLDKTPEAGNG